MAHISGHSSASPSPKRPRGSDLEDEQSSSSKKMAKSSSSSSKRSEEGKENQKPKVGGEENGFLSSELSPRQRMCIPLSTGKKAKDIDKLPNNSGNKSLQVAASEKRRQTRSATRAAAEAERMSVTPKRSFDPSIFTPPSNPLRGGKQKKKSGAAISLSSRLEAVAPNDAEHHPSAGHQDLALAALPTVVQDRLWAYLDVKSLSQLAITSMPLRNIMLTMVQESRFHARFVAAVRALVTSHFQQNACCLFRFGGCDLHIDVARDAFGALGVFLKRATCLIPTAPRLEILKAIFDAIGSRFTQIQHQVFSGWTHTLRVVARGWCDDEVEAMVNFSGIKQLTLQVIQGTTTEKLELQRFLGLFYRRLLIAANNTGFGLSPEDLKVWRSLLFDSLTIAERSKLLFLIHGPRCQITGNTQWSCVHTHIFTNARATHESLCALAMELCSLHAEAVESDDVNKQAEIVGLLEEVTNYPVPWLLDNLASLLVLSYGRPAGDKMVFRFLHTRIVLSRITEVATIFEAMFAVCFRIETPIGPFVELLRRIALQIRRRSQRVQLVQTLAHLHSEAIRDIVQRIAANAANNVNNNDVIAADLRWELGAHELLFVKILEVSII